MNHEPLSVPSVQWAAEYMGEFTPNPNIHALAVEYHERCEAYDRTVCTGPIGRDGIIPVSHQELALVNRNASAVLRDVLQRAAEKGIDLTDMRRAISRSHP
jgi:hypothetical protein